MNKKVNTREWINPSQEDLDEFKMVLHVPRAETRDGQIRNYLVVKFDLEAFNIVYDGQYIIKETDDIVDNMREELKRDIEHKTFNSYSKEEVLLFFDGYVKRLRSLLKPFINNNFESDKEEEDDFFFKFIDGMVIVETERQKKILQFVQEEYGEDAIICFYSEKRIMVRLSYDTKYKDVIWLDERDYYKHIGTSVEEVEEEERKKKEENRKYEEEETKRRIKENQESQEKITLLLKEKYGEETKIEFLGLCLIKVTIHNGENEEILWLSERDFI